MIFEPKLKVGEVYYNKEITEEFGCNNQGGIRPSNKTNTLCLFLKYNYDGAPYLDSWDPKDETLLYYTGTGAKGDQTLDKGLNKKLAESDSLPALNGYDFSVHLFIENISAVYRYYGVVHLDGEPKWEDELDAVGDMRKVVKFPIRVQKRYKD